MLDGEMWKINPDEQTVSSGFHRARRSTDLDQVLDMYNRKKGGAYPKPAKAAQKDANSIYTYNFLIHLIIEDNST